MTDRIPTGDGTPKRRGRPPVKKAVEAPQKPATPAPLPEVAPTGTEGSAAILEAVQRELEAQYVKWGEQNHPLQGGAIPGGSLKYYREQRDRWTGIYENRERNGWVGWDCILLEEAFEALSETDTDRAIEELVQVAAVAVQAILSLERNR